MFLGKILDLRKTLAFRLTLWYAGIFTIFSCIAFILFYTLITTVIRDRTDQELLNQANRFSTLLSEEGIQAVQNGFVIEAQAAGVKKVFFRLLHLNGDVFSSTNVSYWRDIGINRTAFRQLLQGRMTVFETIVIPGRKDEIRILYAMLSPDTVVQIGQAMENYSRFLDAFERIFLSVMLFLMIVATAVGWFMAKHAISGVEAVTRTARKIAGGSLQERVPVTPHGDEIDQLATTFNHMLDRIQTLLKEIKEMSDNIAHDLRSPLTRIRGAAEVTLTTRNTLSDYESMAASTVEECDHLLDMINTMLLISKTESGVNMPFRENVNLADLVTDASELFMPIAEDRNITLIRHTDGAVAFSGDRKMLQRMLSNILDNAVKYTTPGGTVEISVLNDEKNVGISVRDTGIGISESDLPRVFERFYRCDQSRSEAGTGLGLSLARTIARAHGGDISVTSSPNHGSNFTITFPKPASS